MAAVRGFGATQTVMMLMMATMVPLKFCRKKNLRFLKQIAGTSLHLNTTFTALKIGVISVNKEYIENRLI